MATNRTFTMLKPDAIENGHMGKIIDMIIQDGFTIKAMKFTRLSTEQASKFYEVHNERPFYGELVEYMTSGPIIAAILEKEFRQLDWSKPASGPSLAVERAGDNVLSIVLYPDATKIQERLIAVWTRPGPKLGVATSKIGRFEIVERGRLTSAACTTIIL